MIAFQVNDMSCGHCVGSITKAIRATDPGAEVMVDLATHRVSIGAGSADADALAAAIRAAGYTPEPLQAAPQAAAARKAGCCGCGCG